MKHVGQNIRTLRHKQQWSQAEVAKRLYISIPAFSKIETGITDINISRLEQIAELFEVSILEILSRPGEKLVKFNGDELAICEDRLAHTEQEVIKLQRKLISLFDELKERTFMTR